MHPPIDRLYTLKVRDVMCRHVVVVRDDQALQEAAKVFRQHHVSAAPVVNQEGHCVGILSATDFLRRPRPTVAASGEANAGSGEHVRHYMTRGVWYVGPDDRMLHAVRVMCDHHVHRLPVLEGRRVVGVVSTMDIAAALIHAIEEWESESL